VSKLTTSVPASAAGYLVQVQRALRRLAEALGDAAVGVETCDDVSTLSPGGVLEMEQDKLTLSDSGAPITNRSEDFWKTMDIWTDAWISNSSSTRGLSFYLVTNRTCAGSAIKALCIQDRDETTNSRILSIIKAEADYKTVPVDGTFRPGLTRLSVKETTCCCR
jgi:hypothetical protein